MAGFSSGVAAMLVSAVLGGVGLPFGVPPTPEDPVLGRVAPEQCLLYLSWAGTASPDPKSQNQTEQMLAEPEVQHFLKGMRPQQFYRAMVNQGDKEEKESELLEQLAIHPGAIFVTKIKLPKPAEKKPAPSPQKKPLKNDATGMTLKDNVLATPSPETSPKTSFADAVEGGCVFALGEDAASIKAIVAKFVSRMNEAAQGKSGKSDGITTVKIDGQDWYRGKDAFKDTTFGFHGNYFIIALGENGIEQILARMNQEPPKWWTDIRKQLPIERRSITIYADLQAAAKLAASQGESVSQKDRAAVLEILGLSNARAWIEVWGLEGRDFANKSLLLLDGPPQGLLRVLTDQPLRPEDAAVIPSDATFGVALRFDTQKAMDVVLAAADKMEPKTKKTVIDQLDEWEKSLGLDLRHGVLKSFGDTWCVYGSPSEGNLFVTGMTAVVPLRDWAGMNVAYGRLMGLAKQQWKPGGDNAAVPPGTLSTTESTTMESFRFADNDVYSVVPSLV